MEQTRGETGLVQRGPKAIARPGKVMTCRAGIQTGIDTTKQHAQTWGDHVPNSLIPCSKQIGATRFKGDWRTRHPSYLTNSLHSSSSNIVIFTPCDSRNALEVSYPSQLAPAISSGIPSITIGPAHIIQGKAVA